MRPNRELATGLALAYAVLAAATAAISAVIGITPALWCAVAIMAGLNIALKYLARQFGPKFQTSSSNWPWRHQIRWRQIDFASLVMLQSATITAVFTLFVLHMGYRKAGAVITILLALCDGYITIADWRWNTRVFAKFAHLQD